MFNLRIEFLHPWHLLLLIPALALTLIPYFLLSKKYRRTRNRITSMVLHLLIMLLAITTFAGMLFKYDIQNEENVILYLVDVSHSEENASMERDDFLEQALEYIEDDELVEVTPLNIRLRKMLLTELERRRAHTQSTKEC